MSEEFAQAGIACFPRATALDRQGLTRLHATVALPLKKAVCRQPQSLQLGHKHRPMEGKVVCYEYLGLLQITQEAGEHFLGRLPFSLEILLPQAVDGGGFGADPPVLLQEVVFLLKQTSSFVEEGPGEGDDG